jgi:hypothetical protein
MRHPESSKEHIPMTRKRILSACLLAVPAALAVALFSGGAFSSPGPAVSGDYVEARTCDVWTGPCFANGEMNLRGANAVLGWKVDRGSFEGADLTGLSIVAVLDADGTLTTDAEGDVRSMVYVDDRATDVQAKALLDMARQLAPAYLKKTVKVEKARVSHERKGQEVLLAAGKDVKVRTTALSRHCDSVCGNEASFYPGLASASAVECAKAVENCYDGSVLGRRWSDPNKRSAMVGRFSL